MSETPLDLDFKLMPDWVKEPQGKNPYADHPGESAGRERRDGGFGERRPRPGQGRDFRGGGGPRERRDGPREGGRDGGRGQRREGGPRPGGGAGGGRRFADRGPRRPEPRPAQSEPQAPQLVLELQVEFLPENEDEFWDALEEHEFFIILEEDDDVREWMEPFGERESYIGVY